MYYRFASKFVRNLEGGSRKRFLLYFRSFDLFLGLNFRWRKRTSIFPLVLFRREEDGWYLRILLAFLIRSTQTSNGEGQKGNCASTNRPPGCVRMQRSVPTQIYCFEQNGYLSRGYSFPQRQERWSTWWPTRRLPLQCRPTRGYHHT